MSVSGEWWEDGSDDPQNVRIEVEQTDADEVSVTLSRGGDGGSSNYFLSGLRAIEHGLNLIEAGKAAVKAQAARIVPADREGL